MTWTPPPTYQYAIAYPEPQLHKRGCQHLTRGRSAWEVGHIEPIDAENPEQALRLAAVDYAEALDHFDGRYLVQQSDDSYLLDRVGAYAEAVESVEVFGCVKSAERTS